MHVNLITSENIPVSRVRLICITLKYLISNTNIMENINDFSAEELQKCPYHQMLSAQGGKDDPNENTGDWGDIEDDQEGSNSQRNENGGNDNSGGAGSTGSAATNS
jgi:hypothetical protein